MPQTLSIVVSIFGLIGLGYAAARTRLLGPTVGTGLTEFVFTAAIPLLLFQTLANADMHGLSPWRIWISYFVPFGIIWTAADLMVRRVFGRDARAGIVAGGSAAYSNGVLIGVPLMQAAFGERGTVYLIVIVAIHLPVMMLLSVALNEWALQKPGRAWGESLLRLAKALIAHPILIGIFAGVLWRSTGVPIPAVVLAVIDPLARAAGPLALFATGMALVNYGMSRQVTPAIALSALKLIVMPSLVFGVAHAAGLPPLGIAVVTLTSACPTGVNAFLIASRLGTGEALASNTILISTGAGVATVMVWLTVLQTTLPAG